MEIPIIRLRLNITLSRSTKSRNGWEEAAAVGMDDHELARLNQANTRDPDGAPWYGLDFIYGGGRRP